MDIKEKFYANLEMIREQAEQLDEASSEKIGRYISKASKQKKDIQDKAYADKLEKGDLPKFEKRKKGAQLAIKKLTGQAKVPASIKEEQLDEVNKKSMLGKLMRHRKASKKGWDELSKASAAAGKGDMEQGKNHVRNANRLYNLTTGAAKTPKGFPKSTTK